MLLALIVPSGHARAETRARETSKLVIFWGLDTVGVNDEDSSALTAELDRALRNDPDAELLTREAVLARLAGPEDAGLRHCAGEASCLLQIGDRLGVDLVWHGSLSILGDRASLDLRAHQMKGARSAFGVSRTFDKNDELEEAVAEMVAQLLRGDGGISVDAEGAPTADETRRMGIGVGLLGAGVVATGASLYFGHRAEVIRDNQLGDCPGGVCPTPAAYDRSLERGQKGERRRLWSNIALAVAVVLGVSGGAVLTFDGVAAWLGE